MGKLSIAVSKFDNDGVVQRRRQSTRTRGAMGTLGGTWRARGARAYNGGLGAEPPAGSRGRAPGQEVRGANPS